MKGKEKTMNARNPIVMCVVFALSTASAVLAQESMRTGPPTACPHPVSQVLQGGSGLSSADPLDFGSISVSGSVWNQTQVNKHFGHTFHFVSPGPRECCLMTKGSLEVQVKCLQGGGPNTSTSHNDDIELVQNHGVAVPGT